MQTVIVFVEGQAESLYLHFIFLERKYNNLDY